ncbi:MAG: aminomethyl-transferring glycine dehydrogenase subunit GcvPA [Oligoflexia bacterium]|nr:aminomethyl-transferring glycine dehydrogenase subunit GcvPA [Oligoflexia bacterium]
MPFVPHSEHDIKEMLDAIGIKNTASLFNSIPEKYRLKAAVLSGKTGVDEYGAKQALESLAACNRVYEQSKSFIGAGCYCHYIPAAVEHIVSRSEFYTAYTPYQPEISQGTLQAIFEFQSYICAITGMDVSNASMYDGATALAESVLVAFRHGRQKKGKVIVPLNLHPEYSEILENHLRPFGIEILKAEHGNNGIMNLEGIKKHTGDILAVVLQSPNYFGLIEAESVKIAEYARANGAASIFLCIEPGSMGLFKSPAELGFDIAVLELQPLGTPASFGGPHIGVIACRNDYVRSMPGRIVGETVDSKGRRCFVLTLATREQHIRREKATSNICTNQGLVALRTAAYLTLLGSEGFAELAKVNYSLSHYAHRGLCGIKGVSPRYSSEFYNEFVIDFESGRTRDKVVSGLKSRGFLPGLNCGEKSLLVCVTEINSRETIDSYIGSVKELLN